jgi:hypothetical protein
MPNKPSYYERANFLKRRRRRPEAMDDYGDAPSFRKCPSIAELKDAFRTAGASARDTIRLAALMDNLSAFHSPRFVYDGDGCGEDTNCCRSRTSGIRSFLAQDGYLVSRYSTLMRYKRLAERIRLAAGVDERVDLLWGLEPSIPAECRELDEDPCMVESDGCYSKLRRLYCVLDGKNVTEIEGTLALESQRDRFS